MCWELGVFHKDVLEFLFPYFHTCIQNKQQLKIVQFNNLHFIPITSWLLCHLKFQIWLLREESLASPQQALLPAVQNKQLKHRKILTPKDIT